MKIVKVLFLICCFFYCQNIFAQIDENQIERIGFNYYYQNGVYNKSDLPELLKTNEAAYKKYTSSKITGKRAKATGITALSLWGITAVAVVAGGNSERCNSFVRTCPAYVIGPIALTGGLLAVPVWCIMRIDGNIKRKRAIEIFNELPNGNMGMQPMELNLKLDGDGVGVVFSF